MARAVPARRGVARVRRASAVRPSVIEVTVSSSSESSSSALMQKHKLRNGRTYAAGPAAKETKKSGKMKKSDSESTGTEEEKGKAKCGRKKPRAGRSGQAAETLERRQTEAVEAGAGLRILNEEGEEVDNHEPETQPIRMANRRVRGACSQSIPTRRVRQSRVNRPMATVDRYFKRGTRLHTLLKDVRLHKFPRKK